MNHFSKYEPMERYVSNELSKVVYSAWKSKTNWTSSLPTEKWWTMYAYRIKQKCKEL